jgi:type IV pilus assembly protein PilF
MQSQGMLHSIIFRCRRSQLTCLLCLMFLLAGCVTESTGGFNVESSPERALGDFIRLARGYYEQGDMANAKRHLNNAADIDANNSEIHGLWGLVYAREGDLDLADQSFRRAIRANARNSQARNNYAAFLYANGRYRDAYSQLQTVVQDTNYAARSQAFENLGLAAMQLGLSAEAETAFSRALQLNGNHIRASLELASINLERGDVLQARAYYQNFLTVSQYSNIGHSARSLLLGVRLFKALGNKEGLTQYGGLLEAQFTGSPEHESYLQIIEDE